LTGGRSLSGEFVFITPEKAAELNSANLSPCDLVFPHRGAIGEVGIIPDDGEKYVLSSSLMKLTCDVGRAKPDFIYYFFKSTVGRFELLKNSSQVGTPGIGQPLTSLRQIKLSLPPVDEQQEIAAVLRALDDRIALLRETNATLEAIAQALFKSWFVDFDPVHAKSQGLAPASMDEATAALFPDSFEESALGTVPAGWSFIDLGELTQRYGGAIQTGPFGSQLHAKDYVDEGFPVVMPKDIAGRRISTESIARVGATDVERLARHKLKVGDIVFSRRGDVERHALITEREVGWLCGTGCLLVRPGPAWQSPGFLSLLLDAPQSRTWLVQHAVGATMPNLNTGILGSVPVVLPPPDVLAAFDAVVSVMEEQRSRNATMAETLAEIRDALLPRLTSGQLRLPDAAVVGGLA
jgi:type I restriction enzyme, S subunit